MSRITINQLPEPVKRGQVHPKDYWNDNYFKHLEPLVAALKEQVPDAKYDGKALVFLLVNLLHFQEAALGKEAMPPKPLPKLPIKLITDPAVGGALHAIALKVYDIRRQRGLKAIEWQNPGKRRECMELYQMLWRDLQRRDLLVVPKVHISPSCGHQEQRLREYVRRLQGQLAESPDEAGVTHIVYPFGPKGDPDDGKEYTTLLAVKGIQARVHYWYQPDSYDTWIPLHTVDNKEVVPDRTPPGGVWKVTPRWIIDTEKYNEWMNPADYTTPEMDAEMDAAEAADKGVKRAGSALAGQAKKARGDGALEVATEPLEVLGATARLRQVLQPHKGIHDTSKDTVENLSLGQVNSHLAAYQPQLPPLAQQPAAAAAAEAGGDAAADVPPTAANGQQQQQQEQEAAVKGPAAARPPPAPSKPRPVVGAAAAWFKPNAVHPMERAAMPEYFNGRNAESGVRLYRQYRDAMLSLYWENPDKELTFADVRQHIDGEVNGLMRIYEFLQNWGLINCKPGSGLHDLTLIMGLGGGLSTLMPPGTISLYKFKRPNRLEATSAAQAGGPYGKAAEAAAGGDGSRLLHPVAGRKGAEEGLNPSCLTQIFCSAMPWVDCTRLRYHCTKLPDVNLCPQAFAEGRFPPNISSRDFIRIDDSKRHSSTDGWTPEETMLLLEGIELYKENWEKIASHVGKSQSACLTHFVRLPIEDPYIDDLVNWTDVSKRNQQQQQQQQLPPLPFLDEPNPVMSTLGTLSNIMGPKVAAAAAQAALQVLAEQDAKAGDVLNPDVRLAAVLAAAKQGAASNGQRANGVQHGDQGAVNGVELEDADGQQQQQDGVEADPHQPIDRQLMASAVAAGIAAAATRAKQLATVEEREIQRTMVGLVHDAYRRVDAKMNLLMKLMQPEGLDKERMQIESSIKPLQLERTAVGTQVTAARACKKQQEEAAAAAAKQKSEALKKQQAEAAARQKAAAAAQQQQQQQAAAAVGKPPAGPSAPQQQQQQQQQAQQARVPLPASAAAASAGSAGTAAAASTGLPPIVPPGNLPHQQQPALSQEQQLSQPQSQEAPTPGKSTVSMDSRGPGGESGMMDDDEDLGEILEDLDGDGDVDLEGLGDDLDEEMDMP